jgi:hypothetical protein
MEGLNPKTDVDGLEERVEELEGLADALANAPDEELVNVLNRAVSLIGEVNAGIEAGIRSADEGTSGIGGSLDRAEFGDFDAALGEFEEHERDTGG